MTNEQLRAFIAVVERGSFRSAAEHLYKTQPTISAAVRSLERQFNLELFNRDGYRPVLTPEGKAFYRRAKEMLTHAQQLEQLGYQLAAGLAPSLSICISALCGPASGLDLVRKFGLAHPSARLIISSEHLQGVREKLDSEQVDLAIGPHHGLDDRHEFVEVAKVEMLAVASPSIGEVAHRRPIRQSELRDVPHILIADGSSEPFDHVNIVAFSQRWYVNDYQMKKALLLAGMGWSRIPIHMVDHDLERGQLIPLEVEDFNNRSKLPVYLIRLRRQPLSSLAGEFWRRVAEGH